MKRVRVDMRDTATAGAEGVFGQGFGAQVPMAAPAHGAPASRDAKSPRGWLSIAGRIVRNAVIAVALMTLVPVGLTVVRGDRLARMVYDSNANTSARIAATEPVRSYRLPVDPSITPIQAGLALNAMQQRREPVAGFTPIEPPFTTPKTRTAFDEWIVIAVIGFVVVAVLALAIMPRACLGMY